MTKKDEGLYLPDWVYSKLLTSGKVGIDAITLYFFYYHTSNRQHSDTAKATRSYVKTGLGWGTTRFWRANSLLVKEKLVEKVANKDKKTGLFSDWFVRLPFKASAETIEGIQSICPQMRTTGENPGVLETHTVDGEDDKQNNLSKDRKIKGNSFPKKGSLASQGEVNLVEEAEGGNIHRPAKRLFSIPENLTQEQVNWLTRESSLPEEDWWWTDEVYPIFKAHSISKGDTFKDEIAFLNGCLRYALIGLRMETKRNKGGIVIVE